MRHAAGEISDSDLRAAVHQILRCGVMIDDDGDGHDDDDDGDDDDDPQVPAAGGQVTRGPGD